MPLAASVVRIVDADNKNLHGAGYLVTPDTVITCAHVLAAALGLDEYKYQSQPPTGTVYLNRPLTALRGDKTEYRQAQVRQDGWYPACEYGEEPENGLA